jgi:cobalt-zinc-cadmium efflux system protein
MIGPKGDHTHRWARGDSASDRRHLRAALGLIVAFMLAEVVVAAVSGSLALLADAGHMLVDAGAMGASVWATHLAERPASHRWTYGLKRAEIIAAAVNGVTLLVAAALILVEGVRRLGRPPPVDGTALVVVATVGIAVNLAATLVLGHADRRSLNVEGAFQHIVTDLFAFVGTGVAGIVILSTGYDRADAIASIVIVALMLRAAWRLLGASGHVLLEGTPHAVDLDEVRRHLLELPEVLSVHDLHAWTVTSSLPILSAHVVIDDRCIAEGAAAQVLDHLQECLAGHFDVEHSTLQLEPSTHADHERAMHD